MFTRSRKTVCAGATGLLALALMATNGLAQTPAQPSFPGFPTPGGYGSGGAVYTPFNPIGGTYGSGAGSTLPNPFPPYNPWWPQYYMDPVGSYLYGSSAVIGSAGQFQMNTESAQIMHQLALQKQIETAKMMFDLERYIKENTPTFTEKQMKVAKETLKRILQNAAPAEIWGGKALNVLLKDLQKQPDLDKMAGANKIPESTLRQLNVATPTGASLGILKDNGRFNWPIALLDDTIVPKDERDAIQIKAEQLVTKALNTGSVDPNLIKDLKDNIATIREKLSTRVLSMDIVPYMQAKTFLDNFDSALVALTTSNVATSFMEYQKAIKGGKTLPDLVSFMQSKGLSFAPASPGDEGAYEALYSTMANYALLFNAQLFAGNKGGSKTP